jgi:hypothetical protein
MWQAYQVCGGVMSEKEWTIGNIIALAERFGTCIHRNIQAAYYHGEIDIREREKEEANKNEIEARTELEQAVSSILDERDSLRAENEKLKEALREIVELYKPQALSLTAIKMCMVAEQALNEVTK